MKWPQWPKAPLDFRPPDHSNIRYTPLEDVGLKGWRYPDIGVRQLACERDLKPDVDGPARVE